MTPYRRHWGRFYVPGIATSKLQNDGTLLSATQTVVANATETFYEAINAMPDVQNTVWGRTGVALADILGEGTDLTIPHAWPVTSIRVDEILDVQRRRRWESVTNRITRVITI
jgi:hypothetical protein